MNIGASAPCLSSHDQDLVVRHYPAGAGPSLVMFSRSRSRWSLTVVTHVDRFVCRSALAGQPLLPDLRDWASSGFAPTRQCPRCRTAPPPDWTTSVAWSCTPSGGALGWAIPGTCDHCMVRRADWSWANVSLNVHYPTGGRSLVRSRREAYLRPDQVRRT